MTDYTGGFAVSLVVLVFDEAETLTSLLPALSDLGPDVEVIMVDNGSADGSSGILAASGLRVLRVARNVGFGNGVQAGIRAASGSVVVWMPGNGRVVPSEAVDAGRALLSRGHGWFLKCYRAGRPLRMRFRSAAAGLVLSAATRSLIPEPGSTPSGVFASEAHMLLPGPDGLEFEAWSFWRLRRAGLRTLRHQVRFGERHAGSSKWASGRLSGAKLMLSLLRSSSRWEAAV